MSLTVSIEEAGAQLGQLLERLLQGEEEVVIARDGTPVAKLVPLAPKLKQRMSGTAKGEIVITPEFFDPLPDEIIDDFYNGKIEP